MPAPIRVMVAEDSPATKAALTDLFSEFEEEFSLIGIAPDSPTAVDLARRTAPDVALLDVRMPGGGGPAALNGIRQVSPVTRVVAYSSADDKESVLSMLRSGARGYVLKGTGVEELLGALRTCAAGGTSVSSDLSHHLVGEVAKRAEEARKVEDERLARLRRIRRLLEPGAIRPVFQPIVDLQSGAVVGYEALARFVDGRRPDVVFEDAHSAGVGLELELAAVRVQIEAFRSVVGTSSGLYLAVNSSPTTLESPHLLELVGPSAGEQRVIEITEHTDASADMLVRAVLAANQRSIRVAIDDAGAGFSGLKRIVEMSPDVLKLDRSLVTHLDTDRSKRALVAAMAGFAREIGSVIVAEGIETEAELKSLQSLGVDLGQGFLLGRPAPLTRGAV